MKCLITGVNGLVGKNLDQELKKQFQWNVFGLGSSPSTQKDYVQVDLSSELSQENLDKIPNDIECIIHCAALTDKAASSYDLSKVNICGSINAMEIAKKKRIPLFINISGITVIGNIIKKPITEEHLCQPTSFYVQTKLCAEHTLTYLTDSSIRTVHLRIPSPIGLNMPLKTIFPIFVDHAANNRPITLVGDKRRKQNFLDIRDLACAIVMLSKNEHAKGVYNIANDHTVSNEELAMAIIAVLKSRSQVVDNSKFDPKSDFEDWIISTSKAQKDFGYKPKFSLNETLEWILSNR